MAFGRLMQSVKTSYGPTQFIKDFFNPSSIVWSAIFWKIYGIWSTVGVFTLVVNYTNQPGFTPAWHSPYMHLVYYTNAGYWLGFGFRYIIAGVGGFFTWFFGGY